MSNVLDPKPTAHATVRLVASPTARNHGLDVLRGCVALLVVAHHTALTYGGSGSWFYRETPVSNALSSQILSLFCGFNQSWFMGLFFLLAGYFTPPTIERLGPAGFLRERLVRLGIPILVFGFGLAPVTIALARTARGDSFGAVLLSLWSHAYFDLGPPWFCWALLIFSGAFVLWRGLGLSRHAAGFPSDLRLFAAALTVGAAAFALRLLWPVGVNVLGLQLGYFASYVVLFAAGCMASKERLLSHIPPAQATRWGLVAVIAFPILPVAAVLAARVPSLAGSYNGGWTAPAFLYAFWEPFVAWGVLLCLLLRFQRRFEACGPRALALGRRAYAIFIIHPPIVVGVAVTIRALAWPPLAKFLLVVAVSWTFCYLAAGLILRIPGVSRVL